MRDQGLIQAIGADRGGSYELTRSGRDALKEWLAQPVTPIDVSERLEICLLRFAFLQGHPDPSIASAFLDSLADAAERHVRNLKAFLEGERGQALPLHGRLAVGHGVRSAQATIGWAGDARRALRPKTTGDAK